MLGFYTPSKDFGCIHKLHSMEGGDEDAQREKHPPGTTQIHPHAMVDGCSQTWQGKEAA